MDYKLYKTMEEVQEQGKSTEQIKQELYQLWQECFGDSDTYTNFYFKWKVKENQILTVYREQRISAMLHLNPYQLVMKGKNISSNYIVGVATRQQDRRQGLMKKLLEESLRQMYEEKMPFTYLMPAAEAIYSPFDFRIIYELTPWNQFLYDTYRALLKRNLVDSQSIDVMDNLGRNWDESSQIEAQTDSFDEINQNKVRIVVSDERSQEKAQNVTIDENIQKKVRNVTLDEDIQKKVRLVTLDESSEEDINNLVYFSNDLLSKRYDVYVKRTPFYFIRLMNEMKSTKGNVLVFYNGQEAVGYMAYMAEETIYITEAIYNEEWKDTIFDTVLMEDRTVHGMMLQGGVKSHKAPTIMSRIVHLEAFIQDMTAKEELDFVIQVNDPIIHNNNGCYNLHFTNRGCNITRTESVPDLSLTISELTKLCFGKLQEKELDDLICGKDSAVILGKLKSINTYNKVFINDVV
jgi:predicted acetyltransferase